MSREEVKFHDRPKELSIQCQVRHTSKLPNFTTWELSSVEIGHRQLVKLTIMAISTGKRATVKYPSCAARVLFLVFHYYDVA